MLDIPVTLKLGKLSYRVMLLRDMSLIINKSGEQSSSIETACKIIKTEQISHFFDIGANIGLFSWYAIRQKPDLQFFLFEPDKRNISLLKHTIASNQFTSIRLFEGVVANQTGEIDFFCDMASGATGSIKSFKNNPTSLHSHYGVEKTSKVKMTTLDNFINIESKPKSVLIKIDVEGAEKEVFEGAQQFFAKFKPFIVVECFDLKQLKKLIPNGYQIEALGENCNYLLRPL